jgi:hypothetical protein
MPHLRRLVTGATTATPARGVIATKDALVMIVMPTKKIFFNGEMRAGEIGEETSGPEIRLGGVGIEVENAL